MSQTQLEQVKAPEHEAFYIAQAAGPRTGAGLCSTARRSALAAARLAGARRGDSDDPQLRPPPASAPPMWRTNDLRTPQWHIRLQFCF